MTALQVLVLIFFGCIGVWNATELLSGSGSWKRAYGVLQMAFVACFVTVYILFCFQYNSIAAKAAKVIDKAEEYKPIFDTLYKKVKDYGTTN